MENKFDFLERYCQVHKKDVRDFNIKAANNEFELSNTSVITLPQNFGIVIETAAEDFIDYLKTSMNISCKIGDNGNILVKLDETLSKNIAYNIEVSDKIFITGSNEKAVAQAFYYLEDLMNLKKAPILTKEVIKKENPFSPRMIHSVYGRELSDERYIAQIAHHGFDAIMTPQKIEDYSILNKLSETAMKYGIDLYYCSMIKSEYHPDDPGALEYYQKTYGGFLDTYPYIKGIVLVGESIGFPSKDPRTTGVFRGSSPDNIPSELADPGSFPCNDYYKFVEMVNKVVKAKKPDADVVFWSYNWWYESDENRLAVMNDLPKDVSYLCTFELGEIYKQEDITKLCCDYTIAIPGPSKIFRTEAQRAKELGLKFYSQTSTSGTTWDFGTIPYMPVPQKWIKRYKAVKESHEKYDLAGFIEGWTPAFNPSIVSELTKMCYYDLDSDFDENLRIILKKHFDENADIVYKVFDMWSEASDLIHASYDEQYGPARVGTAYPLCFLSRIRSPYSSPWYNIMHDSGSSGFQTNYTVRYETELKMWIKMAELMKQGADILKAIENPSEELVLLENLGRYIYHCVVTIINVHKWHKERANFYANPKTNAEVDAILTKMEEIAKDEIENARASISCVQKDSRLGYEPIDGYVGGEEAILWKIKQVEYVVKKEIGKCRKELQYN